jgi:site-specific DNA-methyltransferase (adenine-specific)
MNTFITTEILKCHIQSYTGLDELDYKFNSYTGDTLDHEVKKKLEIEKFDAVIGNPPYSTDPSKPDTKPLYNKFIEHYIDYGKLLLFVVPSRWFVGGKGLEKFREFMLGRKDIVLITHEEDSKKWFGNKIVIEGGVNYFLKNYSHNGNCSFNGVMYDLNKYDCIIKPEYHEIIDISKQLDSIDKMYMGRYFKVETNDKRYKDEGKIKCYVSSLKSKDRCKFIDEYDFNEKNTFWKVITARANGKSPRFGAMFIGKPNEIHTSSYISFRVENEEEAKSLLSYLQTKIVNHLLSIRKVSQDISENTCKWIPLVPLDRIWTDDLVCDYLKIDKSLYM